MQPSPIAEQLQTSDQSLLNALIGVAIFDLSGLPKTYLTSRKDVDSFWIQTIFHSLGLRSLIENFLALDEFQHAVIHGKDYSVVVMAQPLQYAAILVNRVDYDQRSDAFLEWMTNFEFTMLNGVQQFCDS
jgi:hypothetical protein